MVTGFKNSIKVTAQSDYQQWIEFGVRKVQREKLLEFIEKDGKEPRGMWMKRGYEWGPLMEREREGEGESAHYLHREE